MGATQVGEPGRVEECVTTDDGAVSLQLHKLRCGVWQPSTHGFRAEQKRCGEGCIMSQVLVAHSLKIHKPDGNLKAAQQRRVQKKERKGVVQTRIQATPQARKNNGDERRR